MSRLSGRLLLTFTLLWTASAALAQTSASSPPATPSSGDKATAYYHFSMGHLYAELAQMYGNRAQYFSQAIDHYRLAIKADPGASFLVDELSDLYIQSGRLREGVTDAEAMLRDNPNNLNARRILARIYTRLIGDARQEKLQAEMLTRALEQYRAITAQDPKDIDSWLRLGWLLKLSHDSTGAIAAYKQALSLNAESEDALTGLASVYIDLGDSKSAIDLLTRANEKNPSLNGLMALANAYEQLRDYGKAADILGKALELSPNNVELKRAYAQSLTFAGRADEAEKLYQELSQADPKNVQYHLRLSQIYRQQRRFEDARQASARARQLDPENLEVRYNDVNILEAEGKPAEAVTALREILKSTQKDSYNANERGNRAIFLERLAVMLRSHDRTQEAVDTFGELSALDPTLASRSEAQIIETWRAAKEFEKAAQAADAAVVKYPEDKTIASIRASVLADMGRGEEGAQAIRKLLEGEGDRETWLQLAQIYEKSKNYEQMGKALDAAEKLSEGDDEMEMIYFMRGAMHERSKDFDGAEKFFRKVLEMNPENSSALNYLGYMLADRNVRLQEAHDLVKKALDLEPNNGAYLDSLGWIYYRMDRLPEAETYLRRALERYSRDPVVNDHLGDVYFKQGKLKEAIAQWQAALKEWESASKAELDPKAIAETQRKLESAKVRLAKEGGNSGSNRP